MCTCNAPSKSGAVRRETLNGRKYLVSNFVSLREGVLHGSKGALAYFASDIEASPGIWNGVPLVLNHPPEGSARDPRILERDQLGWVFNDQVAPGRRKGEAWFDAELTRAKAPSVFNALLSGQPLSLSTGLFTKDDPTPGVLNGQHYTMRAHSFVPDHIAVFEPGTARGACDLPACGINVNHQRPTPSENRMNEQPLYGPSRGWTPSYPASAVYNDASDDLLIPPPCCNYDGPMHEIGRDFRTDDTYSTRRGSQVYGTRDGRDAGPDQLSDQGPTVGTFEELMRRQEAGDTLLAPSVFDADSEPLDLTSEPNRSNGSANRAKLGLNADDRLLMPKMAW